MASSNHTPPLWWAIDNELAGMPMPWLDSNRRRNPGSSLEAFDDDLPALWNAGIRSVISLLNSPNDTQVFEAAGIKHLCVPIQDGGIPAMRDVEKVFKFYRHCPRATAVHCAAGLGRTGTIIASILIKQGASFREAVTIVRASQPAAIETQIQMHFLQRFAEDLGRPIS